MCRPMGRKRSHLRTSVLLFCRCAYGAVLKILVSFPLRGILRTSLKSLRNHQQHLWSAHFSGRRTGFRGGVFCPSRDTLYRGGPLLLLSVIRVSLSGKKSSDAMFFSFPWRSLYPASHSLSRVTHVLPSPPPSASTYSREPGMWSSPPPPIHLPVTLISAWIYPLSYRMSLFRVTFSEDLGG